MQFVMPGKCVIVLASLLAAVQGASVNDCGASTFINQSSGGSPAVTDCQQIATNIAGGGTWTATIDIQRTLVSYGTCNLGVTVTTGIDANIGNQDIMDLIHSSIQMFTYNGLVAAEGTMSCQDSFGFHQSVDWGIY